MRLSVLRSLASASLLLALCAAAVTRPHYGGVLRIDMRAAPVSLDPAQADAGSSKIVPLLFDTLVGLDAGANPQPALARGWQPRSDYRHWQFPLRSGVKLQDGSTLNAAKAATALLVTNPGWKISVLEDSVVFDFDTPHPHLPAELARAHNAIAIHADGKLLGTGPYRVTEWQPGHRLVLAANDDYWRGRPYLDAIQVEMGRAYRDQALDLDTGRTDVIELPPDQARRALQEGRRVELSLPIELVALQFSGGGPTQDVHLRQAIALTIDRAAINNVLLQRQGEPSAALLPQWVSGYAFLFPAAPDLNRARELRPSSYAGLTLAYDAAEPLARVLAERLALNVRDAGITMQVAGNAPNAEARIVRLRIDSADPAGALAAVAAVVNPAELPQVTAAATPESLYGAERGLLNGFRIVPLVHIPEVYALAGRVRNWDEPRAGGWPLTDVWLDQSTEKKDHP